MAGKENIMYYNNKKHLSGKKRSLTNIMKLKENADLIGFIKTIKKCRQDVLFRTAEGDCLNLKSTLSQYLFSVLNGNEELLQNGKIECKEVSDYQILENYLQT